MKVRVFRSFHNRPTELVWSTLRTIFHKKKQKKIQLLFLTLRVLIHKKKLIVAPDPTNINPQNKKKHTQVVNEFSTITITCPRAISPLSIQHFLNQHLDIKKSSTNLTCGDLDLWGGWWSCRRGWRWAVLVVSRAAGRPRPDPGGGRSGRDLCDRTYRLIIKRANFRPSSAKGR